jgi:hypothetical protein
MSEHVGNNNLQYLLLLLGFFSGGSHACSRERPIVDHIFSSDLFGLFTNHVRLDQGRDAGLYWPDGCEPDISGYPIGQCRR